MANQASSVSSPSSHPLPTQALSMKVVKYLPQDMYGFCAPESKPECKFFFHLSVFDSTIETQATQSPPTPPVTGEEVQVLLTERMAEALEEFDEEDLRFDEEKVFFRAPRAIKVKRTQVPRKLVGTVTKFDPDRGYGFVAGEDGTPYFIHRTEVLENKLPARGQYVSFTAGASRGKARACYVEVLDTKGVVR